MESNTDLFQHERNKKGGCYTKKNYVELLHLDEIGKLIIIPPGCFTHVHGLSLISTLYGCVDIMGYTLTAVSKEKYPMYSPRGSALVRIKNVDSTYNTENVSINELAPLLKDFLIDKQASRASAIVLCEKLVDPSIAFMEKHLSQQIFPVKQSDDTYLPRLTVKPIVHRSNYYTDSSEWNEIAQQMTETTMALICGGKSVGKSTFLKFCVNRLLIRFNCVRIIDLDPGQSEFTVPGCISVVRVSRPLFGPNYTHITCPDRSIVTSMDSGFEPHIFVNNCKLLLDYVKQENAYPTLINFMGFTRGIGINLLSSIFLLAEPSMMINIVSTAAENNYTQPLVDEVFCKHAAMLTGGITKSFEYKSFELRSLCDSLKGWLPKPRHIREMNILAYLGQMMTSTNQSIFDASLPHFEVSLDDIKVVDYKGNCIPLAVINGGLVALCSEDSSETTSFNCYGWGVVRGCDSIKRKIVLITPESLERLQMVSHLVHNFISLPPSLYMTCEKTSGFIPYVSQGKLLAFGQITKRSWHMRKVRKHNRSAVHAVNGQ